MLDTIHYMKILTKKKKKKKKGKKTKKKKKKNKKKKKKNKEQWGPCLTDDKVTLHPYAKGIYNEKKN